MTTEIDKDTWSKALYQFVEDDAEILPLFQNLEMYPLQLTL